MLQLTLESSELSEQELFDYGVNYVRAGIATVRGGFSAEQSGALEGRGHRLRYVPDLASSPVIVRDPLTGQWTGAADPRRGGLAAGR